ncbi:MAG TPA: hypothetical protein VFG76_10790 [Candidatus Polarisedimenticolia bacterium]|nr:hypothetical protein [Candidatus Polarisedimenticolia bacterium]
MTGNSRASGLLALIALVSIAAGTLFAAARPPVARSDQPGEPTRLGPRHAASRPRAVLLQIFGGDRRAPQQEVSITTIFPERTFSVMADTDMEIGSEEELAAQVREIFSLESLVSLGSSHVSLPGGAALVDDGGVQMRVSIHGQQVSDGAVRLVISAAHGAEETVATSVIARVGKTIVLAGPSMGGDAAGEGVLFLCLTVLAP